MSDQEPIRKMVFRAHTRIRGYEDPELDDGDEDDEDGFQEPSGYGEGDFIRLDNGRMYIRKFEVVGMKWEQYLSSDVGEKTAMTWRLKVYFSDCPFMIVYAEEAADLMRCFGLPDAPP